MSNVIDMTDWLAHHQARGRALRQKPQPVVISTIGPFAFVSEEGETYEEMFARYMKSIFGE